MTDDPNPLNSDTASPGFWTSVGQAMQQGYDNTPWPIKPLGGPYRGLQEAIVQGGAAIGPGWERAARDLVSVPDMYAGSPGSLAGARLSYGSYRPGTLVGRGVVDPSELGVATVDPSMRPPTRIVDPVPSPPTLHESLGVNGPSAPTAPVEQIPIRFGVTTPAPIVDAAPQQIRFGVTDTPSNGPVGAQITPKHLAVDPVPGYQRPSPLGDGSTLYKYHDDPIANVNYSYEPDTGMLHIHQINRGDFPSGSAPRMISDALVNGKIDKPSSFMLHRIINEPTLQQLEAYVDPQNTTLARMMNNYADLHGGTIKNVQVIHDQTGWDHMTGDFDWSHPGYNYSERPAAPPSAAASDPMAGLSDRQRQVAQGLADGKPIKTIANELGISPSTAKVHAAAVYNTLGTNGRYDLQSKMGANPLTGPLPDFTDMQGKVAPLLAQGLSNKEIAAQLGKSVGTVKTHINAVGDKLGVSSRRDMINRLSGLKNQDQ